MRDHDGVLLIDSPPVLAVTDAEIMANSVDQIVLVVRANITTRTELAQTIERLAATRATILGIVLVGVEPADSNGGYGYGYGYGYSANQDSSPTSAEPATPVAPARPRVVAATAAPASVNATAEQPSESLADVIPLWLESPKTVDTSEEDTDAAAFSEAAATGTDRPLPSSSSQTAPASPMSNSAARGLAPIRNRRPSGRPRPRPASETTIDLR